MKPEEAIKKLEAKIARRNRQIVRIQEKIGVLQTTILTIKKHGEAAAKEEE